MRPLSAGKAWRTITAGNGPLQALLGVIGIHHSISASNWAVWLTFCYLWLPFAILPLFAAIERLPGSLMEASSDLGARNGRLELTEGDARVLIGARDEDLVRPPPRVLLEQRVDVDVRVRFLAHRGRYCSEDGGDVKESGRGAR